MKTPSNRLKVYGTLSPRHKRVLESHPALAAVLSEIYEQTARKHGRDKANDQLLANNAALIIGECGNTFMLDAPDEELVTYARFKSQVYENRLKEWLFLGDYDLELPLDPRAEDCKEHILNALVRPQDAMWWRRQLRVLAARTIEQLMREAGRVCASRGGYVSDYMVDRRGIQKSRNQRILEGMEATNQKGQSFTLADLSERGVSNPEKRRLELMTRIRGFEEVAIESGHIGLFLTLTCPSKYHAMIKNGARCFRNPKYRAVLKKRDIRLYGFRIAEPHHDGTPHAHFLVFLAPEDRDEAASLFRKYALKVDGDEAGAQENRCNVVEIDPAKGSAAEYIAKYIGKNINGAHIESEIDEETGLFIEQTCSRVEAWASCWGIRQFQPIGGATVSVYRQLRKVEAEQVDDWQAMLPEAEKMTGDQRSEFDAIHDAADQGNWKQYTLFQGGPLVGRGEQKVNAWRDQVEGSKPGKYAAAVEQLSGWVQTGLEKLRGLFMGASPKTCPQASKTVFTAWNVWEVSRAARSAATRTCVNNCNHLYEPRAPEHPLESLPDKWPDQRTGRAVQTRLWVQTAWRDGCQPVDVPPNVVLSSGCGTGLEHDAEASTNLKVEPVTEFVAEPVGEPSTDGVEPITLTEPKPAKKQTEKPAEPSSGNGLAVAAVLLAPLLIILKGGI